MRASYVTYEDYLAAEGASPTKNEWLDGVVYAMAGGSLEHSRLAMNITAVLEAGFAGGGVESQKVERNGRVIGEALLNPRVIVEVLSDSTEQYDRGEKFAHYMRIPTLQAYVLISRDIARIEVFRRPERGHWQPEEARAGATVMIGEVTVAVDDVYRRASDSV